MANRENMEPYFYTPAEVAEFLRVTRRTVTEWLQESKLQGHQLANKRWIIPAAALRAFLDAGSNMPPASDTAVAASPVTEQRSPVPGVSPVAAPSSASSPLANRKSKRRH